jgi:NitT/TauT family transport system substrate-binding protein
MVAVMSKLPRPLTPRLAAAIVALAALASAGCSSGARTSSSTGPEKTNLVIAAAPTAASAGVYVAQRDGFFRQAGLNVKIVSLPAGADVPSELRNGRVDVVNGAYAGFIQAQVHQAAQFHVLADGYAGGPDVAEVVVPPGSGIRTAKQLEGRTVAVDAVGGVAQLLVSSALAAQGVPAAAVHFVAMGFPAMPAALLAHRIDAAYLPEPYLSQAEERIGGEELLDVNQGAAQDFPIDGYAATVQWCRRYPKTAAAVARALNRGQALAATDRPVVEKALTTDTAITRQIAAIMAIGNFPATVSPGHLQRVPDLMQSFGQLKQHFNMAVMTRPAGS